MIPKCEKIDADTIIVISDIAKRASKLAKTFGVEYEVIVAFMDIETAHHHNPMDLKGLLMADEGNFAHDVFGIRRHLNRETGKLEDCFVPRYSK